jgi:hypothetical protein
MKSRSVYFTLFLVLAVLLLAVRYFRNEKGAREVFDRTPAALYYTRHARCRMDCRHISEEEIKEILSKGIIHLNKSNLRARPCPTFALQGRTRSGESIRVILAQCPEETKVITCYNLEQEFSCHCPGDERKSSN